MHDFKYNPAFLRIIFFLGVPLEKGTEHLDLLLLIPFSFKGEIDRHFPRRLPTDVVTSLMIIPHQAHSAKEVLN